MPRGLSPSLVRHPQLDDWIVVRADRTIDIRTGKVEIGQGILSALVLIAADELNVDPERIVILPADTDATPNEGYTAGSMSIEHGGAAIRQACAHARRILLAEAAVHFGVEVARLRIIDGVIDYDGANATTDYWSLRAGRPFDFRIDAPATERAAETHRWVGHGMTRIDLAEKIAGGRAFVQDMFAEGMLHARVIRPASGGRPPEWTMKLLNVDEVREEATKLGVDRLVLNGNFAALAGLREEVVVRQAERMAKLCEWQVASQSPVGNPLLDREFGAYQLVEGVPREGPIEEFSPQDVERSTLSAEYSRPFLMHGSLAPSAAAAEWRDGRLTVWSHGQGPAILQQVLARALKLQPASVRVIHAQNAGCYGHNGADDVALDAALVAIANPDRRVLLKWSRQQEHGWEPYGSMMRVRMQASLDADGRIAAWSHDVWSFTHVARPVPNSDADDDRSMLLAAWHMEPPVLPRAERPVLVPEVGVHRNAWPLYRVPSPRVVKHFCAPAPLRTSALRGLGAHANVFAIESFMTELAVVANVDSVEFRLRHLADERGKAVLEGVAALASASESLPIPMRMPMPGLGFAVARYKNSAAYAAVAASVRVDEQTAAIEVLNIWICADAGLVVDPDGLINQLEGGAIQAMSWTLKEAVTFDEHGVTSLDWESYPVLTFSEVPEVSTRLIDRPELPSLGAGEATQGPTAAALANAIFDATGLRVRDMPITPERLRAVAAD